jgi:FtsH-binding integral membrane protein
MYISYRCELLHSRTHAHTHTSEHTHIYTYTHTHTQVIASIDLIRYVTFFLLCDLFLCYAPTQVIASIDLYLDLLNLFLLILRILGRSK